jgi:hypothetical protein
MQIGALDRVAGEADTSLPSQITSIFRHSPQRFGNYRDDFIAG